MIIYKDIIKKLRDKGYTSYTIRQNKIFGQAILTKLRRGGEIDTKTISKLCELLECQPGDILEYVPDRKQEPEE